MNLVQLGVLGGLAALAVWAVVRGDWLVKTWRSVALVAASAATLPILALFIEPPMLFVLWVAVGAVLWAPLIMRHTWVMSLQPSDGSLAKAVESLQVEVAKASREFKAGRIDGQTLASRIQAARSQAVRLSSPDAEWRGFLDSWIAELEISEHMARNPGDPSLSIDTGQALRTESHRKFNELVQGRASFWR